MKRYLKDQINYFLTQLSFEILRLIIVFSIYIHLQSIELVRLAIIKHVLFLIVIDLVRKCCDRHIAGYA